MIQLTRGAVLALFAGCLATMAAPAAAQQQSVTVATGRAFHVPEASETYQYLAPQVDTGLPLEVETLRKRMTDLEEQNEKLREHVSQLTEAVNLLITTVAEGRR